jgi:hypothetical protein
MFLAVGALLHQLLCFEATPSQRIKYTAFVLGTLIPVSVYHVWADEIYVHEIVFAVYIFLISRRTRALIKRQVKSEESKKRLGSMATFGICKYPPHCGTCSDVLKTIQHLVYLGTSSGRSTSIYAVTLRHSSAPLVFHGASSSNCTDGGIFSRVLARTLVWRLWSTSSPSKRVRLEGWKRASCGQLRLY